MSFLGTLGFSLISQGQDLDKWRETAWDAGRPTLLTLSLVIAALGYLLGLLLLFGGLMYLLTKSERTKPFVIWLLDEKLKVPGSARRRAARAEAAQDESADDEK